MTHRWYPHLDYAGQPMARGEFRDRQPSDPKEIELRNAAIFAIERFCEMQGFDVPPLAEKVTLSPAGGAACGGVIMRVEFTGAHGSQIFGIGYEFAFVW